MQLVLTSGNPEVKTSAKCKNCLSSYLSCVMRAVKASSEGKDTSPKYLKIVGMFTSNLYLEDVRVSGESGCLKDSRHILHQEKTT